MLKDTELKCRHLPIPINTLNKHKIERTFTPAEGLVRMGFGGTALKLKSSLVLETELHQQITTSIFVGYKCPLHTILKVFFSGGLCFAYVLLPCQSLLKA